MDTRLTEESRDRGEREKKNMSKRAEENMEDKRDNDKQLARRCKVELNAALITSTILL